MKMERRKSTARSNNSEDTSGAGSYDSKKGSRGYFRYFLMAGLFISALIVFYVVEIDPTHVSSLRALKTFSKFKEEDPTTAKEVIPDINDVVNEVNKEIGNIIPEETKAATTILQNLENEDPLPWKSKGNRKKGIMGDRYEDVEEEGEIDEEDDDDDDGDDGNAKEKGEEEEDTEGEDGEEESEFPKEDGESNLRRKATISSFILLFQLFTSLLFILIILIEEEDKQIRLSSRTRNGGRSESPSREDSSDETRRRGDGDQRGGLEGDRCAAGQAQSAAAISLRKSSLHCGDGTGLP